MPNPFFGNANAGAARDAGDAGRRAQSAAAVPAVPATSRIARSPRASTATTPLVVEWSKRPRKGGLGGRVSYTYSVLKDNQIGETNFYSNNGNGAPVNNYNYIASVRRAARRTEQRGLLQPAGGLPDRHPRRAAPHHHRADLAAAVAGQQERRRPAGWPPAGRPRRSSTSRAASRSASRRATTSACSATRSGRTSCRASTSAPPAISPARLASADHPTATWLNAAAFTRSRRHDLRQRAAARDRRPDAAHHQHRPVGVEELRPGRRQVGAAEVRGHQPVQPRADQQHRGHRRAARPSARSTASRASCGCRRSCSALSF